MPRLDGGGAAWGLMRVRQTKTDSHFMAQIWKKRPLFLSNIFLQNIPFFQMTFLNNFVADCNVMDERRTVHIPFLLYIKNMSTCISQVFIIMPMEVKKIILPFIFLPSLISQPEWQLSRIGEEKERKKYTKEDGTVQVLSKIIIISIA